MRYLKWTVIIFVIFCVVLVLESGIFEHSQHDIRYPILLQETTANDAQETEGTLSAPQTGLSAAPESAQPQANESVSFSAEPAEVNNITVGSTDKASGYKFQIELTSRGAAIRRATFSEFDNRSRENPEPLNIIMPATQSSGTEVLAMANSEFMLPDYNRQLHLENLYWQSFGLESSPDGSVSVRFEVTISELSINQPVIKITLDREGFRSDLRAVTAGYRNTQGKFDIETESIKGLEKANNRKILEKPGFDFVWAAAVNKYFAGILVPLPGDGKTYCDWIQQVTARSYDPDGDSKKDSGNETVGVNLNTVPEDLAAVGQNGSSRTYNFRLFVGPKEKTLFDQNAQYKEWGFVNVITFRACCCPACIINPLAFGILAIMKWMHGFWPHNYGIVIIILVFLMRLIIHPLTKKSQVSMSKMSKLAPKAEEIKKKYANNKAEMNKQMMALYREQGASPLMGMLPMFVQMPIWIALWSAVYTSIALRGAEFLPFWITDLSAPDAAYTFPKALVVPFFGWHI
ncbi:MAG: membrane protein insertase YidC, partial [Sedimentisphaerales bacterium]